VGLALLTETVSGARCRRGGWAVNTRKLLKKLLASPANARFEALGFRLDRVSGSHHIFIHPAITELVNLQNVGGQAKPYQVRQLLRLVERHNLTLGDQP
jgi:predicted RNA binding protein YcfA (HicA-like mRNA interferase family)